MNKANLELKDKNISSWPFTWKH